MQRDAYHQDDDDEHDEHDEHDEEHDDEKYVYRYIELCLYIYIYIRTYVCIATIHIYIYIYIPMSPSGLGSVEFPRRGQTHRIGWLRWLWQPKNRKCPKWVAQSVSGNMGTKTCGLPLRSCNFLSHTQMAARESGKERRIAPGKAKAIPGNVYLLERSV